MEAGLVGTVSDSIQCIQRLLEDNPAFPTVNKPNEISAGSLLTKEVIGELAGALAATVFGDRDSQLLSDVLLGMDGLGHGSRKAAIRLSPPPCTAEVVAESAFYRRQESCSNNQEG